MEPRACVAEPDAANDRLTLHVCTQGGWGFRDILAQNLGLEADKVRVLTPDVGGGFGMKGFYYPEYTMAGFAARKLNRPVKWTGERGESFLSDTMGRDHVTVAELAFDASNRITALRVNVISNMGAYYYQYAPYIPTLAALKVLPGVYAIPTLSYSVQGVFTNTVPVDAYRGAGRPELIYCMERVIEAAARELGVDVTELRRINFIKPEQMPYSTAAGEIYDTGEFAQVMDTAMQRADWLGAAARKQEAANRGKYRGIGMCYYIESTMGDPDRACHRPLRAGRHGLGPGRHPDQRPGPRYGLRAGAPPAPGRAVRADPHRPGRHRPDQGRRRHRRLALAHGPGDRDLRCFRRRDREGQGLRGPGLRGGRRRHHLPGRRLPRRRHRQGDRHHGPGAEGPDHDRARRGGRARRCGHHQAPGLDLPQRLPHRRGRARFRHRRRATSPATPSSTISAWW